MSGMGDWREDALVAAHLSCVRGGRLVFENVSFECKSGTALIVRGPNGSGKSSLLRILAGFLKPAEGDIHWSQGMAFQQSDVLHIGHQNAVKPYLTVKESLEFDLSILGGDKKDSHSVLKKLGLEGLAQRQVRFLSAGQKRRLALCRLVGDSRPIWLMDEPHVGLDSRACEQLWAFAQAHLIKAGIIVISSHDQVPLSPSITLELALPRGAV